jgi:signal transduction histidine kinase/FixJ family two-component response regulator
VEELERRFAALPSGAWDSPPTSALLLPLPHPTQLDLPYGFLVVGLNPFRPVDEDYRSFLGLLAVQLASGIASARAYEAERRRAEELAELDRAKTAFFTNVSHELRTPLTLLLAPAEDALADADQSLPDGQRERVEMIVRNGQRLLKLVGTLLDFSRLESRTATALFERTELGHYTAELASMFEAAIRRAGLEFRIECPPLPEPVYVDREMWAKIVLNLLSNALKFTFSGEIAIRVDHHDAHARLSVSDTGIGVEPAEQAKLFERFHRVLGARGRTHEGSGIGLALVAELAVLHGGRAGVESTPGVGSTFTVEVPFGQDHVPADQLDRDVRPVSIEREVAGFLAEASRWLTTEPVHADADGDERDERPRVLVVDDNADMRDYVTSLLATDYSVQTAPDGQAALELARAEPPDLVLTDVMMPRLDGFGLLAALQADPQTLHVPVVMLSARAGEEGVIEGLEAGADDYLIKPFSGRELRARVQANLELDRARRTREQLESSQRMQNEAERLAEVGSWEIDLATGAVRGSEQLLRLVGLPREEFESLTYDDVIARVVHPEDHDAARAELEAAVTGLRPFEHELRLTGDPERILRVRGEIVADEDGAPVTLRGFAQDITRDKRAEQAIAAAAAAREAAEREHAIADSLQRSLLPADVLDSDQLKVATYYQAGVEGTRVGGDWYDAIELGAGRTALVIGDVAGRGVRAASVMGQLRAAVRAYAQLDLPPGELLERLDTMVCELVEGHLVTCIYGVYDPAAQELRYGNAGHLPPVLARPGQPSERLPSATDPPLGARAGRYTERRIALAPGSLVVLYTDGLVERRRRPLDDGIDTLADLVVADDRAPAELARVLIEQLAAEGTEDDIAILIARATEDEMHRVSVLDVPPDASAVHEARSFAETTMRGWDVPRAVIADAALVISELLTNAIVHGRPPIRMRLHKTRRELAVEVDDGDSAMPRKLYAAPEDVRGRGLFIVGELSSRWAARADGTGKTVWSTLALPYDEDG